MKRIPNAITVGKAAVAPLVPIWALRHEWINAFALLAVLVLLDMIDGWIARILKAESPWGKRADPLSDAVVLFCGMWGLVFQGKDYANFWHYGFPLLVGGVVLKILKHQTSYQWARRSANLILPLCYIAAVTVMLNLYAQHAFHWGIVGIIVTVPSVLTAGALKEQRVKDWVAGRR